MTEETIKFGNGKVSTKIPRFELIPRPALVALALRFERGVRIKGDGEWNALTDPTAAKDKQFVIDRLAHCINHCYKVIDALVHNKPLEELEDGGDAGAIMFAGALLACHYEGDSLNESKRESKHKTSPDNRPEYCPECGVELHERGAHVCLKTCEYCKKPTDAGTFISGPNGLVHRHCYFRNNPPKYATSISNMINNFQDPVASAICNKYLSSFQPTFQQEIIDDYNNQLRKLHEKLCQE